jgi:hypothetical protein
MALFSKKQPPVAESTSTPEAQSTPDASQPAVPPSWAMTEEQYTGIRKELSIIISNQDIINKNVNSLSTQLDRLQSDMQVSLNNEILLGSDQDKLIRDVQNIGRSIDRIERALINLNK